MGTVKTETPTVLTSPHPHVSCFSRPFSRFGILPIGGRSTAILLQQPPNQGSIWVLASTPYEGDAPTQERIAQMGGKVKYIIAADNVHSMYTKQWANAFPEAKVIGVEGLDEKRPEIKWAGLYGVDAEGKTSYGFESEIEARYFPTFANKDVTFFHKASRTLLTADLLFNLPAKEQYLNSKSGKPSSPVPFLAYFARYFAPYSAFHSFFLGTAGAASPIPKACCGGNAVGSDGEVKLAKEGGTVQERKERFAKDAEAVAAWDFDRVIMCHGDIVENDGKKAWISAFKKVSRRKRALTALRPRIDADEILFFSMSILCST